jgi:hypothetical protein
MATPEQILFKLRSTGWFLTAAFAGFGFMVGSDFSWSAGVGGAALLGLPTWLWQRWQMARVTEAYERDMAAEREMAVKPHAQNPDAPI